MIQKLYTICKIQMSCRVKSDGCKLQCRRTPIPDGITNHDASEITSGTLYVVFIEI